MGDSVVQAASKFRNLATTMERSQKPALLKAANAGRGVMLLDGDRIEVSANEVVFVQAECPCGLQTLGGTPWAYLLVQSG